MLFSQLVDRTCKAFTLIELLVVMAIIGIMASMILPFISFGQNSSDRNNTKVLLNTLATAIDQFTSETGSVPLPTGSFADPDNDISWYPDGNENDGSWDKQQLWWRLSSEMPSAERAALFDAGQVADLAADPFQSHEYLSGKHSGNKLLKEFNSALNTIQSEYGLGNEYFADKYRRDLGRTDWTSAASEIDDPDWVDDPDDPDDVPDKISVGIYGSSSGPSALGYYKINYLAIQGAIAKDLAERSHLTHPCLELGELLDESFVVDQTIVDAWGNPLIYAAHSIVHMPAVQYNYNYPYMEAPAFGRNTLTDRNSDGVIDSADWDVEPPEMSEDIDHNGDGDTNNADTIYKYDRNDDGDFNEKDWASVLWNSIPGRENSFYMASAGLDGEFNVLVNDDKNDDNVNLLEDYDD
ncbi:MAG: type II secretion system protein [Planctomycetes bacterium]|nr:type II secretion system protein [Planctomycetota bacterium]